MGATGDLQPDPVPSPERVRDRPQIKLDRMRGVCCGIGETYDPVRDIDRPAARGDVAKAGMHVDVRHRRLHIEEDPHRADHLKIGVLGIAGKGKNIRSGFEAAVVDGPR
jgi:hypothetical protein